MKPLPPVQGLVDSRVHDDLHVHDSTNDLFNSGVPDDSSKEKTHPMAGRTPCEVCEPDWKWENDFEQL